MSTENRRMSQVEMSAGGARAGGISAGSAPAAGRKPPWLKKRLPEASALLGMQAMLREHHLHTVCESARCPNMGECFGRGTATFLIMGDICTRDCRFCSVSTGVPGPLDPCEPERVADAAARLGLRHVVVTSVTRDDLPDGGAAHYVATIRALRDRVRKSTIEVLVPDFRGKMDALDLVLAEAPEVFNHNVETVPRLYPVVRPQAVFARSLLVLRHAAERGCSLVKTGWMVGLGERAEEVRRLLDAVSEAGVNIVTIGQYLRPSPAHLPVVEYVAPEVFAEYGRYGAAQGMQVHSSPFVRSSFNADESYGQACSGKTELQ
jgi:lipoyl synthase